MIGSIGVVTGVPSANESRAPGDAACYAALMFA
jgi:hypothetical protein